MSSRRCAKPRRTGWAICAAAEQLLLKADVAESYWTAEIEIPAAQLDGARIRPGAIWGLNVARIRIANSAEYAQWAPTFGYAHRPWHFSFMVFD